MDEPVVYLASSALRKEGYDLHATVKTAIRFRFQGVQLYLGNNIDSPEYISNLRNMILESGITAVVHLPDYPGPEVIRIGLNMVSPDYPPCMFTHYYSDLRNLPMGIGFENAMNRYDRAYLDSWLAESGSKENKRFRVFDPSRLFTGKQDGIKKVEALNFSIRTIESMGAGDLLHLVDMDGNGRWVAPGKGVLAPLIEVMAGSNIPIIPEYESVEECIEAREIIEAPFHTS